MADDNGKPQDEIEAQIGDKRLRIRGSDILGMMNLVALTLMYYGGWMHVVDVKEESKTQTTATHT